MTQDITAWLEGLGLGRYASVFQSHDIEEPMLLVRVD